MACLTLDPPRPPLTAKASNWGIPDYPDTCWVFQNDILELRTEERTDGIFLVAAKSDRESIKLQQGVYTRLKIRFDTARNMAKSLLLSGVVFPESNEVHWVI